ncbi:MAG: nucleoside deaminase [Acidimicrobiia bacterium]|nr:nucleoside deaminase [Acidimicrobiia bacterium]
MDDHEAMGLAIDEARKAIAHGDVPVGAVALRDGVVVASAHNERELRGDPTAHAELLLIQALAASGGGWRQHGVTMVVTLEPCPMCAGALWAAQVDRVVFGADDPKAGAMGSLYNFASDPRLNHEVELAARVRQDECAELLRGFFAAKR